MANILSLDRAYDALRTTNRVLGRIELFLATLFLVPIENWIRLIGRAERANHVTLSVNDLHDENGAGGGPVAV